MGTNEMNGSRPSNCVTQDALPFSGLWRFTVWVNSGLFVTCSPTTPFKEVCVTRPLQKLMVANTHYYSRLDMRKPQLSECWSK